MISISLAGFSQQVFILIMYKINLEKSQIRYFMFIKLITVKVETVFVISL